MAKNEMKAMRGMPLRVPSMEGLDLWLDAETTACMSFIVTELPNR